MHVRRLRIWFAAGGVAAALAIVPIPAHAAPAAPTGPAWSTAGTQTTGCPASLHVLAPTRSSSYFRAHPDELLATKGMKAAGTQRLLSKVANANMHWLSSVTCRPGRPGKPAPRPRTSAAPTATVSNDSHNWSGYETTNIEEGYLGAYMEWPVHDVTVKASNDAWSSTWPGIGTGDSQLDPLIQAGVSQEADCYLNTGVTQCIKHNVPWYEIYPQEAAQEIGNLTVNTQDYMATLVEFDPDSAQAYFEIDDLTTSTGVYMYQDVDASNGILGNPTQAEWIVERPSMCGGGGSCQITPLPNFGTQPIVNAQAVYGYSWSTDPTASTAGQDSPSSIDMYSCNWKTMLAQTGGLSNGTDFSITWKATGQIESC